MATAYPSMQLPHSIPFLPSAQDRLKGLKYEEGQSPDLPAGD